MSIVACPKCGSKISSQAKMCLHCGHVRTGVDDERSLVLRQRRIRDRIYHLKMTSYAVTAVFLAGFGWFWWESDGFVQLPPAGPFVLMGLCAFVYLCLRVVLFQAQRTQRELKQGIGRSL